MGLFNFHNIRLLFGKTKTRSQFLLVATEDGRLMPSETPVRKGCAVDDEKISAFLLDPANLVKDEMTGLSYQLVGERSCVPLCPIEPREEFKRKRVSYFNEDGKEVVADEGLWGLIKGVFHDSWVADLIMINKTAAKMKREQLLLIILGCTFPLAALIIAIKIIRG